MKTFTKMNTKTICVAVGVALAQNKKIKAEPFQTVDRAVKEMSDRHDILLRSILVKLHEPDSISTKSFTGIVTELFNDGEMNWGRIIAAYSLLKLTADSVECGDLLANKFSNWIDENGGWEACVTFFNVDTPFHALKRAILLGGIFGGLISLGVYFS